MKLETFSMLDAVLRLGSMAAAAQEIGLTASAVSIQMKKLEDYLGQQLFDRSGQKVKPLPAAHEVADVMGHALRQIEELRQPASAAVEGTIRLGVIESMQPVLLPGTLQALRLHHPGLRVVPRRGRTAELTNAVKAGELDGAVVAQPETGGSSRLHWHCLLRRELSLIVPRDEKESRLETLFARHEWIRFDRQSIAGRLAARYVNARVREKSGDLELDGVRAIIAMVSAGLGISVVQLSEPGITLAFPVRVLPLDDAPVLRFSFVTRMAEAHHKSLVVLRRALESSALKASSDG